MNPRKHKILLLYQLFIALIALVSILLLLFDCAHAINLSQSPYVWIDRGIWAILVVDYFARLAIAKDKIQFFKEKYLGSALNHPDQLNLHAIPFCPCRPRLSHAACLAAFTPGWSDGPLKTILSHGWSDLLPLPQLWNSVYRSRHVQHLRGVSFSTAFWWALTTVSTVAMAMSRRLRSGDGLPQFC